MMTIQLDFNKIIEIESSGVPTAVSTANARGLMQIQKATWDECVARLGVDWGWCEAFDGKKNIKVGIYYYNTRIPQMLRDYGLQDTIATRIAAYNWGIGNLVKCRRKYKDSWQNHLPKETKNYIKKYETLEPKEDYLMKFGIE